MAALPKMVRACIATYDTTLLCALHIAKSLYYSFCFLKSGSKKSRGDSILHLDVPRVRLSSAKTFSKTKIQQAEGGGKVGPETVGFLRR